MVAHRSQKVSSQEQSSGWSTMLHGTATQIALLMLLLGSWLPTLYIRSIAPLHKKFSTETWKKDPFPRRNYLINEFNIDDINNSYLQVNRYIDDGNKHKLNVTRYKATSPTRNQPQVRHGLRITLPRSRRRSAKRNGKEAEGEKNSTNERYQMTDDQCSQRKMDRKIAEALTEIGGIQVSHDRVVSQIIEKNREELLRKYKVSTSSSDDDDKEPQNKGIDGGHLRSVGAETEEVTTTRGWARMEEGKTTWVEGKTEEVMTTTEVPEPWRINYLYELSKRRLYETVQRYDEIRQNQTSGMTTNESEEIQCASEQSTRHRARQLELHKLSEEEARTLEQRRKDRHAKGLPPMDWKDQLAQKQYLNECVVGMHKMKGTVSSLDLLKWQRFMDSPGLKARIAETKREDEEEDERIRQEEDQYNESDLEFNPYTQGEIERMQERVRLAKERDKVFRYEDPSSSVDDEDEDLVNKGIDGGQLRSVGAKMEEVKTTRVEAKTEEGITAKARSTAEDVMTTTTVITTTDHKSARLPQYTEGLLGKKAQAIYPRSRTEPESGQVDTQGSQKYRRRKRDNETVTDVVEDGGGL